MTVEEINALADEVQKANELLFELVKTAPAALTPELTEAFCYLSYICGEYNTSCEDIFS